MNDSRKNFIQGVITGILLCLLGAGAYFYAPSLLSRKEQPREISFDKALSWIRNKDIKNIDIKSETVDLTDTENEIFVVRTGKVDGDTQSGPFSGRSDATHMELLSAAKDSGTTIKLEPASSGYGWILIFQFLPLGLLFIITLCLAAIAYKALFNKRVD